MHIITKTREVKEVVIDAHQYLCDFCKRDIAEVQRVDKEVTGSQEVNISADIGDNHYYEDGDDRDRYELDCCHECFIKKVIPALAGAGAIMRKKDRWDRYQPDGVVEVKL